MVQHIEYDEPRGQGTAIERETATGIERQTQPETAATAVAAAARATIEARAFLAERHPRDWNRVSRNIIKECERPGFASSARYRKPIGKVFNKDTGRWEDGFVQGLSIRFAEAALRHMTNVYCETTIIYDDPTSRILRITVTDLEANTAFSADVPVPKTKERKKLKEGERPLGQRPNSYGDIVYLLPATDDDILNKQNALASKALRNLTLRVLPGDIQDEAEATCIRIARDADAKDLPGARKKIVFAFAGLKISEAELVAYLGHEVATMDLDELDELRQVYSGVKEGEAQWKDMLEAKRGSRGEAEPSASSGPSPAKVAADLLEKARAQKNGATSTPTPTAAQAAATAEAVIDMAQKVVATPAEAPKAAGAERPGHSDAGDPPPPDDAPPAEKSKKR